MYSWLTSCLDLLVIRWLNGEAMAEDTVEEPECRTIQEYILYKLDRTLAILGIIGIAVVALFIYAGAEGVQIATGAIGGLVGYVGGRTGK